MKNVDALLAMSRTVYYLKCIKRYHTDFLIDIESMIGRYSNGVADTFGWVVYENGTHFLNPVNFPVITGTYIERIFGSKDGEMYMFWWNGEQLIEVTPEELDSLLIQEYTLMAAQEQLDFHKERVEYFTTTYCL